MKTFFSLAFLLVAGIPLIAVPDDLEDAFQSLQKAQASKDPALVKKLAVETCALARKAAAAPAPEDPDQKEAWNKRLDYLHGIELNTEYALFSTAVQAPPQTTIELLTTLQEQNPKSRYLDDAYATWFVALTKTGGAAKVPALAESVLANFPENEDALLVLADTAMTRKQTDRALAHSERLIAVLNRHPIPKGMAAGEWDRKKTVALGRAYWIAGLMHNEKTQYYDADKDLRAALPLISGNEAMRGTSLFYLGVANYQLGIATRNRAKVLEAAQFSEEAAKIDGPLASQALRNSLVMKTEAGKMR